MDSNFFLDNAYLMSCNSNITGTSHERKASQMHIRSSFIQQFVQADVTNVIKCLTYWPSLRGIRWWLVDFLHKGPVMPKTILWHDFIINWDIWKCSVCQRYHWLMMKINTIMVTSSNGNICRVTGPLCGECTGQWWIPRTKASNAALWCSLSSAPQ